MSDPARAERMIEALLFAAAEPLSAADLARRLPEGADVDAGLGGAARRAMPGAASSWPASPTAGASRPRPTWPS